jgi:hypothetical protein
MKAMARNIKMNCTMQKQFFKETDKDGVDVFKFTDKYQEIIDMEFERRRKHFKNLTDFEKANHDLCDGHYHWVHIGERYVFRNHRGDASVQSFGECIIALCPDWVERNPSQAVRSSLRDTMPDPWGKLSVASADVAAFHAAKDFVKSDYLSLMINGACGFGKTSLAKMVESDFLRGGMETHFISCERLTQTFLEAQPTRNEIDIDSRQAIIDMRRADVVVIDDLGTAEKEFTEFFKEQFKMFLDERRGKLIVTTNLNRQQLEIKLNDKIVSRIFEKCRVINLRGKDYRRAK